MELPFRGCFVELHSTPVVKGNTMGAAGEPMIRRNPPPGAYRVFCTRVFLNRRNIIVTAAVKKRVGTYPAFARRGSRLPLTLPHSLPPPPRLLILLTCYFRSLSWDCCPFTCLSVGVMRLRYMTVCRYPLTKCASLTIMLRRAG
jgi:hypothetical protein